MTVNPALPLSVVAAQRDEAVRVLQEFVDFNHSERASEALARIAAIAAPAPAYDGPDRRKGERRHVEQRQSFEERKADRRNSQSDVTLSEMVAKAWRLPVGKHVSTPQPDADGWIAWHGGECPVPNGTRFMVKLRNARGGLKEFEKDIHNDALNWIWEHYEGPNDIIAYRIVEGGEK